MAPQGAQHLRITNTEPACNLSSLHLVIICSQTSEQTVPFSTQNNKAPPFRSTGNQSNKGMHGADLLISTPLPAPSLPQGAQHHIQNVDLKICKKTEAFYIT